MRQTSIATSLFALASLLLAGCGASDSGLLPVQRSQQAQRPAAPDFISGGGLPDVAVLAGLRATSEQVNHTKLGNEALDQSSGALVSGTDLVMDASASGPGAGADYEWALFSHAPGDEALIQATVNFTPAAGGVYVGTADFGNGRWVWNGPYETSVGVGLGFSGAVSEGGNAMLAVVAPRGSNITLNSVVFITESDPPVGPEIIEVDTDGDTGFWPSIIMVEGRPAIAYGDFAMTEQSDGDLMYVRASDATGAAWGTPITVDAVGDVGHEPVMVIVNGNPAITYQDFNEENLLYVRATSTDGSTWGSPQTLRDEGSYGHYPHLAVVNGNPAILHFEWDGDDLLYMRANDANGDTWGSDVVIDNLGTSDEIHNNFSLAIVNGRPGVAYAGQPHGPLSFKRASDADGTAWGAAVPIKISGAQFVDMAVAPDNLACVSWYDTSTGVLEFSKASDFDGSAWGAPVTVDDRSNTGLTNDIGFIDGRPAIAYYSIANGDLVFALADNTAGTSWSDLRTLDADGDTGAVPDVIELGDGTLGVAYTDIETFDLLYIAGLE